jgi:hypothetical protein
MGTIYKLTCDDQELIYYGSTKTSLFERLSKHKYEWNNCYGKNSSCVLFDIGNVEIHEVEKVENKEKLKQREDYYISNFPCVNIKYAYNGKNKKERKHNYYIRHKASINLKQAEKITCECGSIVRKSDIARHKNSKKHRNYISEIPSAHK